MVVASDHDRAYGALTDKFVHFERDRHTSEGIAVQNACLRSDNKVIFLGVADPVEIVAVLISALRINAGHCRLIGRAQILILTG